MAATSINCLAVVLRELGWSYTRLIAELRREAAIDGIVLPKIESLIPLITSPGETGGCERLAAVGLARSRGVAG
jgi:hypothetical protein